MCDEFVCENRSVHLYLHQVDGYCQTTNLNELKPTVGSSARIIRRSEFANLSVLIPINIRERTLSRHLRGQNQHYPSLSAESSPADLGQQCILQAQTSRQRCPLISKGLEERTLTGSGAGNFANL